MGTGKALSHPWILAKAARTSVTVKPQGTLKAVIPRLLPSVHGPRLLGLLDCLRDLDAAQRLLLAACAKTTCETDLIHVPKTATSTIPWCDVFLAWDVNQDGWLTYEEF